LLVLFENRKVQRKRERERGSGAPRFDKIRQVRRKD